MGTGDRLCTEVPLSAHAPSSDVTVTGSLEMGVIVPGSSVETNLNVVNQGLRPATFKVDWDKSLGSSIKIEPPFGEVGPCDGPDGRAWPIVPVPCSAQLLPSSIPQASPYARQLPAVELTRERWNECVR